MALRTVAWLPPAALMTSTRRNVLKWCCCVPVWRDVGRLSPASSRTSSVTFNSRKARSEGLLPSHLVRQMRPQQAVLIHGTLPPIHLGRVRWWREPALRRLVPTDADGRPQPSDAIATCPLTDEPADPLRPAPDLAVIDDPAEHMPDQRTPAPRGTRKRQLARELGQPASTGGIDSARSRPASGAPASGHGAFATPDDPGAKSAQRPNRVAGVCERCNTRLVVGAGEVVRYGRRPAVRCFSRCPSATCSAH